MAQLGPKGVRLPVEAAVQPSLTASTALAKRKTLGHSESLQLELISAIPYQVGLYWADAF